MPAQNTASSGGESRGGGRGRGGGSRGGGGGGRAVVNRALVAEPLGAEMGEQAEAAVITPAMLKEEEQLEAAGLEKERQMLERVRARRAGVARRRGAGSGRRVCQAVSTVPLRRQSARRPPAGRVSCGSFGCKTKKCERLWKFRAVAVIHRRLWSSAAGLFFY